LPTAGNASQDDSRPNIWNFRLGATCQGHRTAPNWYHHWEVDGEPWLSLAKHDDQYLLRFHDIADFAVAPKRREIIAEAIGGTPVDTLIHLLLNQVIALIAGASGRLVVHASAVRVGDGAIAFVGKSGQGKSTLAASFGASGFPLVTDDCLMLDLHDDRLIATPSYPGLRLWHDSAVHVFGEKTDFAAVAHYTSKKRVGVGHSPAAFADTPLPLTRMYFLDPAADAADMREVRITPLSPRDVFTELVSFSFQLDVTDRNVLRREFELLGSIATRPLFFRLSFPHDYSRLPEVQRAILAHAGVA